ncbi:MAG TPA: tetratricopeptide repeat-containing diguanylate cyclase [Burkholderiaceae bacterium]|nr:tetratricopeptide repeat-containing diguanylate cyclase [Burkholderiaceae bacterium]
MSGLREEFTHTADAALAAAHAALDQGDVEQARDLAQSVLNAAKGADLRLEAGALSCLAHIDRVGSRLRRAAEASRRAAQLFEQLGDIEGEARALTTLTHVCMLLGRNDEAVEAALLAVRLCEKLPLQPQTVLAHNSLGLAYSWSGDHESGDASLEKAVELAQRCTPPLSTYNPRLNQAWVEASRLLDERYQTGTLPSIERLQRLLAECQQLERAGSGLPILPGLRAMARTISLATAALVAVWQGDLTAAEAGVAAAAQSLQPGVTSWLDSFVRWCAAELAWARRDWAVAEHELIAMKKNALAVEHEQLAARSHLLLAQVYESQGKDLEARAEHRALWRRQRRVLAESLSSRESLVSWQLGARQSERHLQQALVASKQFERWSLEDALTGIANRRHFEQSLEEKLQALGNGISSRPLTVAMVDVDKFKLVNDRYTHRVGDRVLKTIAAIIASQVRENDLVARWAGDEFVVLFDNAGELTAEPICERIRIAVAAFDWESVAAGLRMAVSLGLSEAHPGDTAESVLHRSDKSMYQQKSAGSPPA